MGFLVMIAGIYMKGFREPPYCNFIQLQFHESADNNNNLKSVVFLVKLFSLVSEAHMIVMLLTEFLNQLRKLLD